MDKDLKNKLRLIFIITIAAVLFCLITEHVNSEVHDIKRNDYGGGKKKETFKLSVEKEFSKKPIEVEIDERKYTEKEKKKIFQNTMDQLEKIVLGKNKSVDHVDKDLNFISEIEDSPVEILWESNNHKIIDSQGKIQEKNIGKGGLPVEIKAVMNIGEDTCIYMMNVVVYPRKKTPEEIIVNRIEKEIRYTDRNNKESKVVELPREIYGRKIRWEREKEKNSIFIATLGMLSMILVVFQQKEKKEKEEKKKQREMEIDYPDIVNKLSLLMEAGMNVKNAWEKIVNSYLNERQKTGQRYAYEEMNYAMQKMKGGMVESECYEEFGRRCKNPMYMKLGSLLSQNFRKGTKGISKMLAEEAKDAFMMRKLQAVKLGEEAGTKLLFPMGMMLAIVLVIIMVPAFLSISI